jgi:hypothetical protein
VEAALASLVGVVVLSAQIAPGARWQWYPAVESPAVIGCVVLLGALETLEWGGHHRKAGAFQPPVETTCQL